MRPRDAWAIGLGMLLLGWQTRVDALTAIPRTFAELVERADCVLIGTVMRVTTAGGAEGEKIYTYVTLEDLDVLKGEVPDPTYVLRVRGGGVDTHAEGYPGLPRLEAGGGDILFGPGNFGDLFPVLGLDRGVFRVELGAGRPQEVGAPL